MYRFEIQDYLYGKLWSYNNTLYPIYSMDIDLIGKAQFKVDSLKQNKMEYLKWMKMYLLPPRNTDHKWYLPTKEKLQFSKPHSFALTLYYNKKINCQIKLKFNYMTYYFPMRQKRLTPDVTPVNIVKGNTDGKAVEGCFKIVSFICFSLIVKHLQYVA